MLNHAKCSYSRALRTLECVVSVIPFLFGFKHCNGLQFVKTGTRPGAVPGARILAYGDDTRLSGSQSEASILDLSSRLLESIKTVREEEGVN